MQRRGAVGGLLLVDFYLTLPKTSSTYCIEYNSKAQAMTAPVKGATEPGLVEWRMSLITKAPEPQVLAEALPTWLIMWR